MLMASSFDVNNPELWLNRALMYGDGVFETMRLKDLRIPLWSYHMERLQRGLTVLGLAMPDVERLSDVISGQCPDECKASAVVKLVVFRSQQKRTYEPLTQAIDWLLTVDTFTPQSGSEGLALGWATQTMAASESLAGIKHLSRLEQVMMASDLSGSGCDDLLVQDHQGQVIETTHQNLVVLKNQQIITPGLDQCGVHGVALAWLKANFKVVVKAISVDELQAADGVLVCNALHGFRWVNSIAGQNSFLTADPFHDKINGLWDSMFNS